MNMQLSSAPVGTRMTSREPRISKRAACCLFVAFCLVWFYMLGARTRLVGIVLPGAVLVLYTVVSRDWRIWERLHIVPGLALFFAITAPWFVLVSLRNSGFPEYFFIREHFGRFTSGVHQRGQPWHYFLPFLLLGTTPWFAVLAQSLRHGARNIAPGFNPGRLLVVWAVSIFVFFSLSNSKLPAYILPIFPALALLIAHYLESSSPKAIAIAAGWLALAGAAALDRLYMPWIAVALALAHRARTWALVVLAAAGFIAGQVLMLGTNLWDARRLASPTLQPSGPTLPPTRRFTR